MQRTPAYIFHATIRNGNIGDNFSARSPRPDNTISWGTEDITGIHPELNICTQADAIAALQNIRPVVNVHAFNNSMIDFIEAGEKIS